MRRLSPGFVLFLWLAGMEGHTPGVRTAYVVKQVASGAVYLDGGSNDGLKEGMRLKVWRLAPGEAQSKRQEIGDLTVTAVASLSAVCELQKAGAHVQSGDTAELSYEDLQTIEALRSSKSVRHVAQTVSFSEGDPIEEEAREYIPRPPSPEVNKIRGRVAFEQSILLDHSTGLRSLQEGLVLRLDMARIEGSYWNFTGYWRGRLSSQSGGTTQQTLNDLLNRTYQIGVYYNNPNSNYVAGFGRYLLPWAPSLNTMDGGYFGRRFGKQITTGVFAGSTPNPTAWNYDPNRQMAGTFVAFEEGSYETVRFTSTAGMAVTRNHWHPEREFLFFENSIQVNTKISIYHDLEADKLAKAFTTNGNTSPRLARSFLTVRYQPIKAVSIDLSHNYFRDVPTFDTRLLGTGLLDQFLFQGFSGGVRLDLTHGLNLYGSLGRSKRDQDTQASLNYMGGLVIPHLPSLPRVWKFPGIPTLPFRTDFRYSKFASSFGVGSYESVTLSRQLGNNLRFDIQGGLQNLKSTFTTQTRTKYGTATLDYLIRTHYILGLGWTLYHGGTQNYDQMFINLGYRF
ncbi:MAG: hypothetical protein U0Q18_21740 [Bryobacteraceae bacterium]